MYSSRIYYSESIFESFNEAEKFVKHISEEEEDAFFSEIVSYVVGSYTPDEEQQVWYFDKKGELIVDGPKMEKEQRLKMTEMDERAKYKIGDFVFLRAFPWNKYSSVYKDVIGVISESPPKKRPYYGEDGELAGVESSYTLFFIDDDGILDHCHAEERSLLSFEGELPDELEFLKVFRNHITGKNKISHNVCDKIWESKPIFKKVAIADWGQDMKIVKILVNKVTK